MSTTPTGLRRFLPRLKRDGEHFASLSHEQVRAQEAFNARLRGYGNNDSTAVERLSQFGR